MIYLDNKHGNVTINMQYMWPISRAPPKVASLKQCQSYVQSTE